MLDDKMSAAGASASAMAMPPVGGAAKPKLDEEPGWKAEFRQTLAEVLDKGFSAYANEINEKKLEELREKILEAMGYTEGDLDNMSPEQRQQIEKMVALEIQKRLAAEKALAGEDSITDPDGISSQMRVTPNGMGAAFVMLEIMEGHGTEGEPGNFDREIDK